MVQSIIWIINKNQKKYKRTLMRLAQQIASASSIFWYVLLVHALCFVFCIFFSRFTLARTACGLVVYLAFPTDSSTAHTFFSERRPFSLVYSCCCFHYVYCRLWDVGCRQCVVFFLFIFHSRTINQKNLFGNVTYTHTHIHTNKKIRKKLFGLFVWILFFIFF